MLDNIKNCNCCGKIYIKPLNDNNCCPECLRLEEEKFQEIKKFLNKNPGANMYEVSESTGISIDYILKVLKEGRLTLSNTNGGFLKCENCNALILTGRLCNDCKNQIQEDVLKVTKASEGNLEGNIEDTRIKTSFWTRQK